MQGGPGVTSLFEPIIQVALKRNWKMVSVFKLGERFIFAKSKWREWGKGKNLKEAFRPTYLENKYVPN